jgi:Bacterial nucleoid DNA-binding protein
MKKITKEELVKKIARGTKIPQRLVKPVVNMFVQQILKEFKDGNSVIIRGFGQFHPYLRKARTYYNPKYGTQAIMQNKVVLRFKPMKDTALPCEKNSNTGYSLDEARA